MSFRARLTTFFVVIVVVPMIAVGALVFRLIGDSQTGKADARAAGLASAAASFYGTQAGQARLDAQQVARTLAGVPPSRLAADLRRLQRSTGLARLALTRNGRTIAVAGAARAVAAGSATARAADGARLMVTASTLTAPDLIQELTGVGGVEAVVTHNSQVVASSLPAAARTSLPRQGSVRIAGTEYRTFTEPLPGFDAPLRLTTLSDTRTSGSVASDRAVAIVAVGVFLLLAFGFAVLSARALHRQLRRFLEAARRLASGDFSEPVPTEGRDEFAALGQEFNRMSTQLEERLAELERERERLRASLVRIGETFASGLDRQGLIDLALRTGLDAVEGGAGRVTVRQEENEPLVQAAAEGDLGPYGPALIEAEREALASQPDGAEGRAAIGEASGEDGVISVVLGHVTGSHRVRGLMTLIRSGRRFDAGEREVLGELAVQVARALENVDRHHVVSREAVTDRLTGLANRGQFNEMLGAALESARRYHHPVALIMLDIDDFKRVNDTYGHPQGDLVLKRVADAVRANSRDADTPARYGGEEMALILPHTDLDGAYAIAERVRTAVEELAVRRLDGNGDPLRVTASLGVAASGGEREGADLLAEADAALYRAKYSGKNRTGRADALVGEGTAGVTGGE